MVNKKGLSDVITTVLIIVIVIVAIGMIAAFLVPLLKGTTDKAQGVNTCLTIDVLAKKCEVAQNGANDFNVSVLISRGVGKTEISEAKIILEKDDGSSNITNFANPSSLTEYATVSHSLARTNFKPKFASVAVKLSGANSACDASEEIECKMVSSVSAGAGGGTTPGPSPSSPTCTDSDGGNNPNTAGIVTLTSDGSTITSQLPDICSNVNTLSEQSCASATDANSPNSINCPNGCSNGACNAAPAATDYLTGLIAYWKFDETAYTGATAEVQEYLGISPGTSAGSPTIVSGLRGNAVRFTGASGQRILISTTSSNFNLNKFTLTAWIKTTDAGSGRRRIFSQQTTPYYGIALNGNNLECFSSFDIGVVQFNRLLNDDQWHQVSCVRNNGVEFVFYIDGVRVNTLPLGTGGSYTLGNTGIVIGQYIGGNSETFIGNIDEMRVYNSALDNGQINQIYNFTKP